MYTKEGVPEEGAIIEQCGEELLQKLDDLIPGFDGMSDDLDICSECIVEVVKELRIRGNRPTQSKKPDMDNLK
jgi:hypothetical protein